MSLHREELASPSTLIISHIDSFDDMSNGGRFAGEPMTYNISRQREPITDYANWASPFWRSIDPLTLTHHMGKEPKHRPTVQAKLAWDDNAVIVFFRVEDRFVRALAEEHQDPVYKDSCVEFFFTPGEHLGHSYFNLEMNCGGTMLFWWHPEGAEAIPIAVEHLAQIEVAHSLPKIVEPEITEQTTWTVAYRLPFEIVKEYCPNAARPRAGAIWNANFYKCADASSHPHWMTWAPVDHPAPKFHLPAYFGRLKFV